MRDTGQDSGSCKAQGAIFTAFSPSPAFLGLPTGSSSSASTGVWRCLRPVPPLRLSLTDNPGFVLKVSPSDTVRDGIRFHHHGQSADIDEKEIRMEKPEELVMALAEAKADAIISKLRSNGFNEQDDGPTLLITADQVVVHGGMIREKPSSPEEAHEFIKGYSQGHASTVGSVLVTNLKTGVRKGGCDKSEIYFHKIPDNVIANLIEEGDVLYVAGGLMVEHPLTSPFVEAIVGTIDSVMGLPKALTKKLIDEAIEQEY
ncbi:7-methyl-GTP pyrophosphatase-like isoform X1 [Zingiber officinale]|uniref:7-methyl-GTP pyrophosphatase-like isoform X1 n=2 Tax=Zingiber officinale TaxID=94328 RepID=UPI001C4CB542|nr:7-methyl-GTP pyrophosphatase-like isoform X1 [Zingiber officinale]